MLILTSGPTVTNCVFDGNSAAGGFGGGMLSFDSAHPTILTCVFKNNSAVAGAGMANFSSSNSTVINCSFNGNFGATAGGGGMYLVGGTIVNCSFHGNWATLGGGLHAIGSPTLINCTFSGNAAQSGAGLYLEGNNATITNCSIYGNFADFAGGGMWLDTHAVVDNCILWANSGPDGVDESAQIHVQAGTPEINFCNIQGLVSGGAFNSGISLINISADPLFADPAGADGMLGTADDNFRLTTGSPCIDAGNSLVVAAGVTTDLAGDPRFADDPDTPDTGFGAPLVVDMGAYEFQAGGEPIPTVSQWGLVAMLLLVLIAGTFVYTRRRAIHS